MTIQVITASAVIIVLFLLWHAIRCWGRRDRIALYVLIPALLCFALGSSYAVERLLGYATDDLSELEAEFLYLYHVGDGETIFLLALPQGAAAPRLYGIPGEDLSEGEMRALTQAGAKAGKGVGQMGTFAEGEMELHDITAERLPPKTE